MPLLAYPQTKDSRQSWSRAGKHGCNWRRLEADGYLCGIELDGKDHLRQSARDRDIERQAILESKGWTILRVWSVDFFADPEGEYNLLKKEIDSLLEEKRAHVDDLAVEPLEVPEEDSKGETNTSLVMF